MSLYGLPDNPGDESLEVFTDILFDLHGQHFRRVHLLVEKFDHPPEFSGYLIGHEDQTHLTGLKVCLDLLPESLYVVVCRL